MQLLKQSTAYDVTILMIDSADHVTGKTGLAAGLTIYATKAGGAPATITPTVTELDATNVKGLYKLAFTTAHTNTLGELQLHITASGSDPTDRMFLVVAFDPYVATNLGLSALPTANPAANGGLPTTNGTKLNQTVDLTAAAVDAIWDELIAGHLGAGSVGEALNAAGSAGDPWTTALPGAYSAGQAGKIVGDNINATISSRSTYAGGDTSGVTTLLARLTGTRAGNLDFLDESITTVATAILAAIAALPTAAENADELLDQAAGIETNRTVRQGLRLMLAALVGILSGAAGTTVTIRDTNDTVNRIVADVDSNGNRTAVVLNAS